MTDEELLQSDEFVKFSNALTTPLMMQVSDMNSLYNKKNKNLRSELKKDWVIGYIFGWTNFLYQQSSFSEISKTGFWYILYGIYSKWKISGLDEFSEHRPFFKKIEKKIDKKNNELFKGFEKGNEDAVFNLKNRGKDVGRKISLKRYLLEKVKEK
ncbi:hypothetical protein N9V07_03265 [Candidatus Pelagibacter sp.]|nr:hypothetical protein [Candidatus Pelagibacter sp.]